MESIYIGNRCGKYISLRCYNTREEAIAARKQAEKKLEYITRKEA